MNRKHFVVVGAVAAYAASILLMSSSPVPYLLAFSGITASVAIALILVEWTRS